MILQKPSITEDDIRAVGEALKTGWLGTGEITRKFEQAVLPYTGHSHCAATSSCSAAIEVALRITDVKDKEVITSPNTFCATVNAIIRAGGIPRFVDITEDGLMDAALLESSITARTRVVMPVHFAGKVVDLSAIKCLKELSIIEDCAHTLGANLPESDNIRCFSFYPTKPVTTIDGGLISCNDSEFIEKARILTQQGVNNNAWERKNGTKISSVLEVGMKANMPNVNASLGLSQLARFDAMQKRRREIFRILDGRFERAWHKEGDSCHLYCFLTDKRDLLLNELSTREIITGIHYLPVHLQPAYQYLGYKRGDFPMAEKWGNTELTLPTNPEMTDEDVRFIIDSVKEIIHG